MVTGQPQPGFSRKQGFVNIVQVGNSIQATCSCGNKTQFICQHLFFVLSAVYNQHLYFHFVFDHFQRHKYLRECARRLGVPNIENPDEVFSLSVPQKKLRIIEKVSLFSKRDAQLDMIIMQLEQTATTLPIVEEHKPKATQEFILLKTEIDYDQSQRIGLLLLEASLNKSGEMKNGVRAVQLSKRLKTAKNEVEMSFFSSCLALAERGDKSNAELINAYLSIIKNPFQLPIYRHHTLFNWGTNSSSYIKPSDLQPIEILNNGYTFAIHVKNTEKKTCKNFMPLN